MPEQTKVAFSPDGAGLVLNEPLDRVQKALNLAAGNDGAKLVPLEGADGRTVYIAAEHVLYVKAE